jgi:aspartyl-tRNA(Asn)/glutamyl-tRNA(Gln) amidotransferase subunit C
VSDQAITTAEVAKVALLARLSLTDDELERFTTQLASILGHAADLALAEVDGLATTAHPLALENVLRADEPRPSLSVEAVLAMAPEVSDGRFQVPPVMGDAP